MEKSRSSSHDCFSSEIKNTTSKIMMTYKKAINDKKVQKKKQSTVFFFDSEPLIKQSTSKSFNKYESTDSAISNCSANNNFDTFNMSDNKNLFFSTFDDDNKTPEMKNKLKEELRRELKDELKKEIINEINNEKK
jgi:hypothetical protein